MHQPNSLSYFSQGGEAEQCQQGGSPRLGGKLCVQTRGGGADGLLWQVSLSLGSLKNICITLFFSPNVFDSIWHQRFHYLNTQEKDWDLESDKPKSKPALSLTRLGSFLNLSKHWFYSSEKYVEIIVSISKMVGRNKLMNARTEYCALVYMKYLINVVLVAKSNSFETPWTVAHQAPLSMEFSRKEL